MRTKTSQLKKILLGAGGVGGDHETEENSKATLQTKSTPTNI